MSDHGDGEEGGGSDGAHCPIWMISFADMLILMLSFFVIMSLVAGKSGEVDEELLRVVASIKIGFGYVPDPKSQEPLDLAVLQLLAARKNQSTPFRNPLVSDRAKKSSDERQDKFVKLKAPLGQPILFERNADTLLDPSEDQVASLQRIADLARPHLREIIIHGHCAKTEAGGEDRGFKLAYDRARRLQQELGRLGIAPNRIRLVACSYFSPYSRMRESDSQKQASEDDNAQQASGDSSARAIDPEKMNRRAEVTLGSYFLPTHGSRADK